MTPPKPQQHSFEVALASLLTAVSPPKAAQNVRLAEAFNRISAHVIVSPIDVPPADNSQMDGYAVRSSDCQHAGTLLKVTQRIPAGKPSLEKLQAGQAARIFTGGFIPEGADAVVMQEMCTVAANGSITVNETVAPHQWVRPRGADIAYSSKVLPPGTRLHAAELGLIASLGHDSVSVTPRLRVGLLCTGDELIEPGQSLPFGCIYNSNRPMLSALLCSLGCEVVDAGNVADTLSATQAALAALAINCDLIISTGGVSVGEEDHVKPAVQALGALDLWNIAIKPGKPLAFGRVAQTPFIGLPGNPVSSFITFVMLVRPYILRTMGVQIVKPQRIAVKSAFTWTKADKRREFLRVQLNDRGEAELFHNQNSAVLTSAAWAHGLADVPAGSLIAAGDMIAFIPMSELR
jgi:molybdopterin molybdotransferase